MRDSKLRASPARSAVVSAIICGLVISVFCSLLHGRGQFVWNWEIPVLGGFAAFVGALRGWKDAKDFRDTGGEGSTPAGDVTAAGNSSSNLIVREELHQKLARAAQVRSVLTMLSVIPAWPIAFGVVVLLAQLGAPAFVINTLFIGLIFGAPLVVARILTDRYCKTAVPCPFCKGSLWACGSGNFKPRRMKVRYDAKECPHCGTPII